MSQSPKRMLNGNCASLWTEERLFDEKMAAFVPVCRIFTWGANTHGQLCVGHKDDLPMPTEIPFENLGALNTFAVKQICGGGGHVAFLTETGKVYTCGLNNRGQLGHDSTTNKIMSAHAVEGIKAEVSKLACGWEHTLCITNDGTLWGWGANNYLQLSCFDAKHIDKPQEIMINPLTRISDVAAGLRHSLAVSDKGQVYIWGSGRRGQLGVTDCNGIVEAISTPFPVNILCCRIIKVACGSHHSIALSDAGELFVWGCNRYGQLALDPAIVQQSSAPMLIPSVYFNEEKIRDVMSGWSHILALTDSNKVFSWGRNDYGQLGRQGIAWQPLPLQILKHIWQVSTGAEHNIAIVDDQKVVAWGWNEHGICGIEGKDNVFSPKYLPSLQPYPAAYVGTGYGSSFAVVNSLQNSARNCVEQLH